MYSQLQGHRGTRGHCIVDTEGEDSVISTQEGLHSRLLLPPRQTPDHSLCQAIGEDRRRRRARHLYNLHVLAELEKVGGFTYEVNLCPPDPILGSSHSVPPRG